LDNYREKLLVMPEWLLQDENYTPQSDKDTFINKSILSLLRVLARIKTQDSGKMGKYQVNAALKVAFTFMLVVLLSMSRSLTFVVIIYVYLLGTLSTMEVKDIVKILRVSFVMALFTFVVLLPAALWGNSYSSVMITSKVLATITAVNILSHSTRWSYITSALKRFFVPDIFILVLDITIKYIVMLGDFTLNMMYALKLRSVGKNNYKYASLSGIAGTMFIKSKEMAEDMYAAMECRGFTGEYQVYNNFKFKIADLAYVMLNAGIILTFVYFGRI
jgi:cobalt/nickel transport system permease protein